MFWQKPPSSSTKSTPVVRSVELPNGSRMVIVRKDAFQTALKAARNTSARGATSQGTRIERKHATAG